MTMNLDTVFTHEQEVPDFGPQAVEVLKELKKQGLAKTLEQLPERLNSKEGHSYLKMSKRRKKRFLERHWPGLKHIPIIHQCTERSSGQLEEMMGFWTSLVTEE